MFRRNMIAAAGLALMTGAAQAHTGIGDAGGLFHGFVHPMSGIDHILAMVGVGLFAAQLGGHALWLVPASFVAMMAGSGALAMAGVGLPFVELGIALSVVALGLVVLLQANMATTAAMALVGFFALFHGHAHGAEMPQTASGLEYAAGFVATTAMLHSVGLMLGFSVAKMSDRYGKYVLRAGGAATALAGAAILAGYI